MGTENAVLAYYSIRSKQNYIYKTNKIKEIVGASYNITKAFSLLTDNARFINADERFNFETVKKEFDGTKYDAAVVFEGGGNLVTLYKSSEVCKEYNQRFSKALLEKYYSMTPLCAFVEIDIADDDYTDDYKKLMAEADRIKKTDALLEPCNTLPFVLMDRNTFQPIKKRTKLNGVEVELTAEREAKLMGEKTVDSSDSIKLLDELITEKGKESLLAVVYADGNNMGAKITKLLDGKHGYDECVNALRNNSVEINNRYVETGIDAVKKKLGELSRNDPDHKSKYAWRKIVGGGDEITFICNAGCALALAQTYLEAISDENNSACAGIAVFHSHYPFSAAYKIAEQACENAKISAKEFRNKTGNETSEISAIDFQFIHSGSGTDLDDIRENQNGKKLGRPYCVCAYLNGKKLEDEFCKNNVMLPISNLYKMQNAFRVARSSVKEMGTAISADEATAKFSYERILSQNPEVKNAVKEFKDETAFKLLYDLAEFYDLWFIKNKNVAADNDGKGE